MQLAAKRVKWPPRAGAVRLINQPVGEHVNHVNRAIVFGITEDPERVKQRKAYAKRRGYRLVAVLEDWATVLRLMREGMASIIIFVDPDEPRPIDADGGETRRLFDLARGTVRPAFRLRPAVPRALQISDVKRTIEDTGPIPTGLDPAAIRAARRIWRHFNNHGCA